MCTVKLIFSVLLIIFSVGLYPCVCSPDSSSGYVPYQPKSSLKALNSSQRRELDFDTSSEEHVGTGSPTPPLHSAGTPSAASSPVQQHTNLNSQDSKTSSSVAKSSQPPVNGVQQCLEQVATAATAASSAQHPKPETNMSSDPTPPALPPKTRKAKVLEAPKVSEHSDWGDSDMDEETYSSGQEKLGQKVKKVWPLCS